MHETDTQSGEASGLQKAPIGRAEAEEATHVHLRVQPEPGVVPEARPVSAHEERIALIFLRPQQREHFYQDLSAA